MSVRTLFTDAGRDLSDRQGGPSRADAFGRLARDLGVRIAIASQVHGRDVLVVDADAAAGAGPLIDLTRFRADALVTALPGVAVAVRVADCVPVLLADLDAGVVAAAHAGRAGVLAGVLGETVATMRRLGARRITATVGPHICGACYEVPDAMAADYAERTGVGVTRTRWGTAGIDLGAAVARQLDAAGVGVRDEARCTLTSPELHSHRRDAEAAGRQAGLAWLPALRG